MDLMTRLALRGRIITILLMLAVMAGGAFTLTRMQIELFPNIDFPIVSLVAPYPQADAERVLREVTAPLEEAMDGVEGMTAYRSITTAGLSIVIAEFDFGTDMEGAASAIADNVSRVTLPEGVPAPRAARVNPDEFPILQISVLSDGDLESLFRRVTAEVLPELSDVPGVFSAELPPGAGVDVGITRTNGEPSVSVVILKDPDASTVTVVDAVNERLDSLRADLQSGLEFVTVVDQAPQIRASIESLEREATLGALFAVGVIFLFLLSARPTLVTSISIPASILGGLLLMGWQGMTLNMMTLGGLAIAVGRVVDDSIVVLENVYRHIQMGGDRVPATLAATKEVIGPITTSTLTTIAVFLPLVFIGGIIGAFFLPFALSVTFALLASWLVALTVVPVVGSLFIKPSVVVESGDTRLQRVYTPVVRWALGHKAATLAVGVVLFVSSFGLLRAIPMNFLPSMGGDTLTVDLTLPRGTDMETARSEVALVETLLGRLRSEGTVDTFHASVGGGDIFGPGGGGFGGSVSASFFVLLSEDADGDETSDLLSRELAGDDRSVRVAEAEGGGPQSNLMELTLTGEDYRMVAETADRLVAALAGMDALEDVGNDGLLDEAVTRISRVNGRRAVTISGSITDDNTQRVNQEVDRIVEEVGLPDGVFLEAGGVFENMQEAFAQMGRALLFGIILVYVVMVVSMRSLRTPFVIILSLPLASIGALGALFLTQRALGLPALIGVLMLVGLVVTNAIVLIGFVEQLRARGMSVYDSLVEGGRTRLRPILMTAFTTSFALVPMAVIVTEGGIIGAELATVVIGGLMTSTFLTLVVIPVIYSLVRREGRPREAAAHGDGAQGSSGPSGD